MSYRMSSESVHRSMDRSEKTKQNKTLKLKITRPRYIHRRLVIPGHYKIIVPTLLKVFRKIKRKV